MQIVPVPCSSAEEMALNSVSCCCTVCSVSLLSISKLGEPVLCYKTVCVCVAACSDRSSFAPTRLHSRDKQQKSSRHLFLVSFPQTTTASLCASSTNNFSQTPFIRHKHAVFDSYSIARVTTEKRMWSRSNTHLQTHRWSRCGQTVSRGRGESHQLGTKGHRQTHRHKQRDRGQNTRCVSEFISPSWLLYQWNLQQPGNWQEFLPTRVVQVWTYSQVKKKVHTLSS